MVNKLNIILDLDETLVSSYPVDEFPFNDPDIRSRILGHTFYNMESYYIIFERPHLQDFLDYLFKNFNVSVWSAGSRDYVSFIVENAILKKNKNRKLDYLFWSYHCKDSVKRFSNKKNLDLLWDVYKLQNYTSKNTILIDDLEETCITQPKNAIIAREYNWVTQKKDGYLKELKRTLSKLKQTLS